MATDAHMWGRTDVKPETAKWMREYIGSADDVSQDALGQCVWTIYRSSNHACARVFTLRYIWKKLLKECFLLQFTLRKQLLKLNYVSFYGTFVICSLVNGQNQQKNPTYFMSYDIWNVVYKLSLQYPPE